MPAEPRRGRFEVSLPADGRAARLRRAVDRSYQKFVANLPTPARKLAGRRATYTGEPNSGPFAGPSSLNPVVSGGLWLFWEAAAPLPDQQVLVLGTANAFLGCAYAILDHLTDRQSAHPTVAARLQQMLLDEGQRWLKRRFPERSPCWSHFERQWGRLERALSQERRWQQARRPLGRAHFRAISAAKAAPINITVAALAEAADRPDLMETLIPALGEFMAGAQLAHDVLDWPEDAREQRLTFFLGQVAPADWAWSTWPSETKLAALIQTAWSDVTYLALADEWLGRAGTAALAGRYGGWAAYLRHVRQLVDNALEARLSQHIVRVARQSLSEL